MKYPARNADASVITHIAIYHFNPLDGRFTFEFVLHFVDKATVHLAAQTVWLNTTSCFASKKNLETRLFTDGTVFNVRNKKLNS